MTFAEDVARERRRGDRARPRSALDAVREHHEPAAPLGRRLDPVLCIAERSRPADGGRPRIGARSVVPRGQRRTERDDQQDKRGEQRSHDESRLWAGAWWRLGRSVPPGLEIPDLRFEARPRPPVLDSEREAGNDETCSERAEDESSERDAVEAPDEEPHGRRRAVLQREDGDDRSEQRDDQVADGHERF